MRRLFAIAALLSALAGAAGAQAVDPVDAPAAATGSGTVVAASEWDTLAVRAVEALLAGRASDRAFEALREELAAAREVFQAESSANSGRLQTLDRQLAALGLPPESGEEPAEIAELRSALDARRAALVAPAARASARFAEADGLIAEIDALLRQRQTDRFLEREQSPLSPAGWAPAWRAASAALRTLAGEVKIALTSPQRREAARDALPVTVGLLAIAAVLTLRGRNWSAWLERQVRAKTQRGQGVWSFLVSLGRIVLPFLGLIAVSAAVQSTGLSGRRLTEFTVALPYIFLPAILSHWLVSRFRPPPGSDGPGLLGLPPDQSRRFGRAFLATGYAQVLVAIVVIFVDAEGIRGVPASVILFPVGALLAVTVFRVGQLLVRARKVSAAGEGASPFRGSVMGLVGRLLMAVSVIGTALAALGYDAAFEMAVVPAVATLYLLGVLMLAQKLVFDFYALVTGAEEGSDGLLPVSIAFFLALASLPVLALIWGARVTDLTELWVRFQEGFDIGGTRISPSNFLIFVAVFVVGYTLVRLLQGALRSTVLPKTKLDVGGQNAVTAGTGYVGIFLAAVVAITTAGIDLSGLAIVAGALSVGIGFGLQNIVSNFISGIILLVERPIGEGDWIEVGGQMGFVRDISVRSTRIETFDRTDVIIPNADLISGTVTNYTRGNKVGRVILPVGVAYGTDTRRVEAILREIAEAHPMVVLDPPPGIFFMGFGASSLDFEIRAILRDVTFSLVVKTEINHAIAERFAAENIEIPFAQTDIWVRNPEALRRDSALVPPAEDDPEDEPSDSDDTAPSGGGTEQP